MESADCRLFLFLVGAIAVLLTILTFFVPILLLGVYRSLKDIKDFLKKEKSYLEHKSVGGQKLHDIFLSIDAEMDHVKETDDKTVE